MTVKYVDLQHPNASEDLVISLAESGFAVVTNHGIPDSVLKDLYKSWQHFFDRPDKQRYTVKESKTAGDQAGFYPPNIAETAVGHTQQDLKEYFHVVESFPLPPEAEDATKRYKEFAFSLGKTLLQRIQRSSPPEAQALFAEPLDQVLSARESLLRVLHYPPLTGNEQLGALRAAPHEDINFITLLPAASEPGLQILNQSGNWVDIETTPEHLVINTGDMLSELSGAFYPSTTHQVVNPKTDQNLSRLSAPYFLTPRLDLQLSQRHTAGSYLQQRLNEIMRH